MSQQIDRMDDFDTAVRNLANTVPMHHDAMAAFERKIAELPLMQRMATEGGTGRNHPASRAKRANVDTLKTTN